MVVVVVVEVVVVWEEVGDEDEDEGEEGDVVYEDDRVVEVELELRDELRGGRIVEVVTEVIDVRVEVGAMVELERESVVVEVEVGVEVLVAVSDVLVEVDVESVIGSPVTMIRVPLVAGRSVPVGREPVVVVVVVVMAVALVRVVDPAAVVVSPVTSVEKVEGDPVTVT